MAQRSALINFLLTTLSIAGIYIINAGLTPLKSAIAVSQKSGLTNYSLPPGYVFSIWGFIYLGFFLFSVFELRPKARQQSKFEQARSLILLSVFLNFLWIVLVGLNLFIVPFLLQWVMLAISIAILLSIRRNNNVLRSGFDRRLVAAFSLYAGWLTVAMIPFTSEILLVYGWNGGPIPAEIWAAIIFTLATGIVLFTYRALGFIWYIMPLVWALSGIAIKFDGLVSISAGSLAALTMVYFCFEYIRSKRLL